MKRWDSPQTLFYCDPPYPGTIHQWRWGEAEQKALMETLDSLEGSYVLSGYAGVDAPATCQRILTRQTRCSATGQGKVRRSSRAEPVGKLPGDNSRTEVLWICDRSSRISEKAWDELDKTWRRSQ